jgi:hypothetical protein
MGRKAGFDPYSGSNSDQFHIRFLGLLSQRATKLGSLKMTEVYFLTIMEIRSSKSRCHQGWFHLGA